MTRTLLAAVAAATMLAACSGDATDDESMDDLPTDTAAVSTSGDSAATGGATAALLDAQGRQVATVTLRGADLEVHASAVAPGEHGVHVHSVGRCDAPAFESAGDHLNPAGAQHGLDNPAGPHMGDLPNLTVGADSSGHLMASATLADSSVFDADGSAVVIHADADDQRTDPSGNSGDRIACGVLSR